MPYDASAESLWRAEYVYDLIITLSHNQRPRMRGAGSAIFMHVAAEGRNDHRDLEPTAGCIALRKRDWARIAPHLRHGARLFLEG
jgi:L,D-peptidoglycan transpeptidase YkuD (ErfK/YbiS/YcfS/YnhG family)